MTEEIGPEPGTGGAEEDESLGRLEQRIAKLKAGPERDPGLAQGLALVFSMGFVIAATLVAGSWVGEWLQKEFKAEWIGSATVLVSLLMAALATYKLMRPYLEK